MERSWTHQLTEKVVVAVMAWEQTRQEARNLPFRRYEVAHVVIARINVPQQARGPLVQRCQKQACAALWKTRSIVGSVPLRNRDVPASLPSSDGELVAMVNMAIEWFESELAPTLRGFWKESIAPTPLMLHDTTVTPPSRKRPRDYDRDDEFDEDDVAAGFADVRAQSAVAAAAAADARHYLEYGRLIGHELELDFGRGSTTGRFFVIVITFADAAVVVADPVVPLDLRTKRRSTKVESWYFKAAERPGDYRATLEAARAATQRAFDAARKRRGCASPPPVGAVVYFRLPNQKAPVVHHEARVVQELGEQSRRLEVLQTDDIVDVTFPSESVIGHGAQPAFVTGAAARDRPSGRLASQKTVILDLVDHRSSKDSSGAAKCPTQGRDLLDAIERLGHRPILTKDGRIFIDFLCRGSGCKRTENYFDILMDRVFGIQDPFIVGWDLSRDSAVKVPHVRMLHFLTNYNSYVPPNPDKIALGHKHDALQCSFYCPLRHMTAAIAQQRTPSAKGRSEEAQKRIFKAHEERLTCAAQGLQTACSHAGLVATKDATTGQTFETTQNTMLAEPLYQGMLRESLTQPPVETSFCVNTTQGEGPPNAAQAYQHHYIVANANCPELRRLLPPKCTNVGTGEAACGCVHVQLIGGLAAQCTSYTHRFAVGLALQAALNAVRRRRDLLPGGIPQQARDALGLPIRDLLAKALRVCDVARIDLGAFYADP